MSWYGVERWGWTISGLSVGITPNQYFVMTHKTNAGAQALKGCTHVVWAAAVVAALRPLGVVFCARDRAGVAAEVEANLAG